MVAMNDFDKEHKLIDYKFMSGSDVNSATPDQFLIAAAKLLQSEGEQFEERDRL
jgi:hypothetical protein